MDWMEMDYSKDTHLINWRLERARLELGANLILLPFGRGPACPGFASHGSHKTKFVMIEEVRSFCNTIFITDLFQSCQVIYSRRRGKFREFDGDVASVGLFR